MRKSAIAAVAFTLLASLSACGRLGGQAAPVPRNNAAVPQNQRAEQDSLKPGATVDEVLALVKASAQITAVPSDLAVPLSAATEDGTTAGTDGCLVDEDKTTGRDCVYGDPKGTKTVVLFGDSHAGMWQTAFDVAGKRDHVKIALFAKPACAVATLHFWLETTQRPNTECDVYRDWAIKKIVALRPDTIVLTSLWQYPRDFGKKEFSEAAWAGGMTTTIDRLKVSGAKIVILGDMPYLSQSAPECLAAHQKDVKACSRPASEAIYSEHAASDKRTVEAEGGVYVDVTPWFCTDVCEPIIGNMIAYVNQYHISATYSRYLSDVVGKAVGIG